MLYTQRTSQAILASLVAMLMIAGIAPVSIHAMDGDSTTPFALTPFLHGSNASVRPPSALPSDAEARTLCSPPNALSAEENRKEILMTQRLVDEIQRRQRLMDDRDAARSSLPSILAPTDYTAQTQHRERENNKQRNSVANHGLRIDLSCLASTSEGAESAVSPFLPTPLPMPLPLTHSSTATLSDTNGLQQQPATPNALSAESLHQQTLAKQSLIHMTLSQQHAQQSSHSQTHSSLSSIAL